MLLPQRRAYFALATIALVALSARAQAPLGMALYRELRSVGLDEQRVYRVRDLPLDRGSIHLTLTDGTLAFTRAVNGRVTGAFFEREGEVLLSPSVRVERASLHMFTCPAILEETFSTAYLRFNDDTADQL